MKKLLLLALLLLSFKLSSEIRIHKEIIYYFENTKYNNPFNISYNHRIKWEGQSGRYNNYVKFERIEYGLIAGIKLVHNYIFIYQLNTVDKFINIYCPENNIEYKKFLINKIGNTLNNTNIFELCRLLLLYESNYKVNINHLKFIWKRKFSMKCYINPNQYF